MVNPFQMPGRWYKANLHTHTTSSDGKAAPLQRVEQYRKEGYDVLALTDHRTTNDITGMSDRKMLVISGIEYHPLCPTTPGRYHLVGLNVPHGFKFADAADAIRCIAEVRAAGGASILAHPSWCGQGYEDFRELKGVIAVEVYNATCDRHGRPSSASEWAIALDRGWRLPAVGTDDAHMAASDDVFECWTWLKMPALGVANVLKVVAAGACYSTCGPKIHDFRVADGKVTVRSSRAVAIHLSGAAGQGKRRRAPDGKTITSFSLDMPKWPYVRAMVTDQQHRMAWSNPIFLR